MTVPPRLLHSLVALAAVVAGAAWAAPAPAGDDGAPADYSSVRPLFWSQLYAGGGETLYCGVPITRRRSPRLNVEHVFPMSWAARAVGCGRRRACRRNSARFNRIEADMHNLYPARADVNQERGSMAFGIVRGERRRYRGCDFEVHHGARIVEPRPEARGKIARAMFYMAHRYRLRIFPRQRRLLRRWNRAHPPDAEERRRNDAIERLQGNRNPYIDDPALADAPRP